MAFHCESSFNYTVVCDLLFWFVSSALLLCSVHATHEAEVFHFEVVTGTWSNCYRLNSSLSCYRTREAVCARSSDNLTAPWYYCTDRGLQRTETVEECEEEGSCQQDCAVSQWSAWSSCNCNQNFYSNRTREVISPPRNGGLDCPSVLEREVCLCTRNISFDAQPRRHTWKIEGWGPCRPLNISSQCGVGLRSRAVLCVDLEGKTVGVDSCLQEPAYSSLIPPYSQTHCELPCPCVLGEWGNFSSCVPQCEQRTPTSLQTRSRPVIQYPSIGLSCASTEETMECIPTNNNCTCPVYKWSSSAWSMCNFQSGASCGDGYTTRFVYCLEVWNGTVRTTHHSQCEELANTSRPPEIMACSVKCPQACLVGEWSDWTPCPRACQQTYSNRTRSVIVPPVLDECPNLLELVQCPILPCARWLPEAYMQCVRFPSICGKGFQSRTVRCVGPNNEIMHGACEHLLRPNTSTICHIPCPNDCVVSEWSQWSSCSETCGGHMGNQMRMRHIVVAGLACPYNDTDLLETRSCSSDEDCVRTIYYTEPLDWEECVPVTDDLSSSSSPTSDSQSPTTDSQLYEFGGGSSCGEMGTRNRTSVCMRGEQLIPDSECPIEIQLEIESCELPCSRECVYSEWSSFSECSCGMGMGVRNRSRYLIQFSSFSSTSCTVDENGFEVETEICNSMCDVGVVGGATWHTNEWSQCYLYQGISPQGECGVGYRNRTVSCINTRTGLMVSDLECISSLEGESRPAAVSSCHVACTLKCLVTEWSELDSCIYGGNKTRQRTIVPYGGCDNWELCCPQLSTISLRESVLCLSSVARINTYEYIISEYSKCILDSPQATCGNGMKYRQNQCVYLLLVFGFVPVDESFCKLTDLTPLKETQSCNIKCELNCVQTDWRPWSPCSVSCGSGYRTRSRTTRSHPEPSGRPCGPLSETDVCFSASCPRVEILPGPFGMCVPSNSSSLCGDGERTRELVCLVDGITRDLGECESAADLAGSISLSELCVAPCPGECVTGEWSEWSPCSTNCPSGSCQQTRTRDILREAQSSCSETVQELLTCYTPVNHFNWVEGPWLDCIIGSLETSTATVQSLVGHYCGVGLRRREITCMNGTDNEVHESLCMEAGIRRLAVVENCTLPCPIDCKVGAFSDWTECVGCELMSYQQRERHVIVPPQFKGQECPDMMQRRTCAPTGCVVNTLFNHTSLEFVDYTRDGQCGSALKLEPLSCLRNTEFVSPSECLEGRTRMEKYVSLPCPSEPNCTYGEWADWSDCMALCSDHARPFRHRHRHLLSALSSNLTIACAAAQHQTEECLPENQNGTEMMPTTARPVFEPMVSCIDFMWHTSQWNRDGRDVYCQSSTNVRVEDVGCPYFTMPRSRNETCVNVTCPDYSTCSDSGGVCLQTCEVNFEQVEEVCLPRSGCADDTHCVIPNMECNFDSGSCECKQNYRKAGVSQPEKKPLVRSFGTRLFFLFVFFMLLFPISL